MRTGYNIREGSAELARRIAELQKRRENPNHPLTVLRRIIAEKVEAGEAPIVEKRR